MIATALRSSLPSLRTAVRAAPRVAPVRMMPVRSFQTSRMVSGVQTMYTAEHEWIRYDDETNIGKIGITNHAQESLGDVVYIELPPLELEVAKGDQIGSVESVKAASDIYTPVNGIIVGANTQLGDEPGLINKSPMEKGWLAEIKLTNPGDLDDLLTEEAYLATLD